MRFRKYYESTLFSEMPAVTQDRRFFLDEDDDEFLEPFLKQLDDLYGDKLKSLGLMEKARRAVISLALRKRYSQDVIGKRTPEVREISLNSQFKYTPKGSDQTKTERIPLSVKVNTNVTKLIDKLESIHADPGKININNIASDRVADEWIAKKAGHGEKEPELTFTYAFKDYKQSSVPSGATKPSAAKVGGFGSSGLDDHRQHVKTKDPIELDADDHAFIDAFRKMAPHDLVPAFMDRYSNVLINNSQQHKSVAGHPPGMYVMWPVKARKADAKSGREAQSKGEIPVPVNIPALKKRLAELEDKWGVDFTKRPLARSTAKRWIAEGEYKPGFKSSKDIITSLKAAGQKFDMVKQWVQDQQRHLDDPDNNPSPNIATNGKHGAAVEDFDWYEILEYDAEQAQRIALTSFKARTNHELPGIDREDIKNVAMQYLASDDAVRRADYGDQEKRIEMASRKAMEYISQYAKEHGGGGETEMGNLAGRNHEKNQADRDEVEEHIQSMKVPTEQDVANMPVPGGVSVPTVRDNLENVFKIGEHLKGDKTAINKAAVVLAKMMKKLQDDNPIDDDTDRHVRAKALSAIMLRMGNEVIENRKKEQEEEENKAKESEPDDVAEVPPAALDAIRKAAPEPTVKHEPLTAAKLKQDPVSEPVSPPAPVASDTPKPMTPKPAPKKGYTWRWDAKTGRWEAVGNERSKGPVLKNPQANGLF